MQYTYHSYKKWPGILVILFLMLWGTACNDQPGQPAATATAGTNKVEKVEKKDLLYGCQNQLKKVIIRDVFSPPVASRIYAYTSLAFYEAIKFMGTDTASLAARMHGFTPMPVPVPGQSYNYTLAAFQAFFTVAKKVTFSVDSFKVFENSVTTMFKSELDSNTYKNSVAFGDSIGKVVLKRANADNYKKTRGMPKNIGSAKAGNWQPTAPDYMDGVEPYWQMIKPLTLDSANQFPPPPPPAYSTAPTSKFYQIAKEVYTINKALNDSQRALVTYWDDNPLVMQHQGHLAYANKKLSPGGHWMGISSIAAVKSGADMVKAAKSYVLTAVALFDGFIACWHEKYHSNVIRPVSYINNVIDSSWQPFLQTPPFPEYTSGHSVISTAAATVLTDLYGDGFAFHDNSDSLYIGATRDFSSFLAAAKEAAISRLYGGIHYRPAIEAGAEQGKKIGTYILNTLR